MSRPSCSRCPTQINVVAHSGLVARIWQGPTSTSALEDADADDNSTLVTT